MLTKNLLKYTVRGDKVFPKYLNPKDEEAHGWAVFLLDAYSEGVGGKHQDLLERLKLHPSAHKVGFQALSKLLEDRCEFSGDGEDHEVRRWALFEASKNLRAEKPEELAEFRRAVAAQCALQESEIDSKLYADLPEFRLLTSFASLDKEELIHRLNAAQVQGLLLRSTAMEVTIQDGDLIKRRRLLQRLKFWRLLAEVEESQKELKITISGPLSLFEASQTYGMRLSNFFPYILLMDKWSVRADIKFPERTLQLEVDSKRLIQSHYKQFSGYVPLEFQEFLKAFNNLEAELAQGWGAELATTVLNLGQQNYVVPDVTFRHPDGRFMHLELFHKWHESQLKERIKVMGPNTNIILGVAKDLLDKASSELGAMDERVKARRLMAFRKFPTPKAIMTYLSLV